MRTRAEVSSNLIVNCLLERSSSVKAAFKTLPSTGRSRGARCSTGDSAIGRGNGMRRTNKKGRKPETLAEQHRRLVPVTPETADSEWLEQPEPTLDTTATRIVTTYGTCEDPL